MRGRSHRSFVSYIDKSRQYYAAQGFERPYRWAFHHDVPFARLPRPLAQCRIGTGTTADRGPRDARRENRLYAAPVNDPSGLTTELFWDRDATHTGDLQSFLPLDALADAAHQGRIGGVSERFYGISTDYSHRRVAREDAPQIERWMREDGVDAAILAAL